MIAFVCEFGDGGPAPKGHRLHRETLTQGFGAMQDGTWPAPAAQVVPKQFSCPGLHATLQGPHEQPTMLPAPIMSMKNAAYLSPTVLRWVVPSWAPHTTGACKVPACVWCEPSSR